MFSQFQVRYPTGSLISELLTIYNGKYVVRVAVEVDGVTRATGMAVADTIELAEDQARSRALEVMEIRLSPTSDPPTIAEFSKRPLLSSDRLESQNLGSISTDTSWLNETNQTSFSEKTSFYPIPSESHSTATGNLDWKRDDYLPNPEIVSSGDRAEPNIAFDKVTPIGSRRQDREMNSVQSHQLEASYPNTGQPDLTSPIVDNSEKIARIMIEIKRLGWNNKQGSEYLQRKYNKKTRQELTNEELQEFLEYLTSLPSPT